MTRPARAAGGAPVLAVLLLALLAACGGEGGTSGNVAGATYVGVAACAACHASETAAWRGSHHDLAMDTATAETVLGDFDETTLTAGGVESRFFRRDGGFWVETEGPDGAPAEYEVGYTFGVSPLQQYLVPFPGGRLQALHLAWDTRPADAGGQRWFHLLGSDPPPPGDELHWTGRTMNWNYMCAACHSTNLDKGYDAATDRYETTWSEIDVSCESCHGPGSEHAAAGGSWPEDAVPPAPGAWVFEPGEPIARRTEAAPDDRQIETCAYCHARRGTIAEGRVPGEPLLDAVSVSRLDEGLYHADGQILEEVYVYGSFVQSRMYAAGVRCSDCHEPHSLELRQPGNAVCASCHLPSTYDQPAHHNHTAGSTGAQCVSCHMPARTYMVVDPRRDHSMRIPRPHLTAELGTPNACADCHADRGDAWAVEAVERWYGAPDAEDEDRMRAARSVHAGREGLPGAADMLRTVAADPSEPGIVRATALAMTAAYPSPATLVVLDGAADDPDALVRVGALAGLDAIAPESRTQVAFARLRDPVRAVRLEAARVLAPIRLERLGDSQQSLFWEVSDEYVAALNVNADHPSTRTNLGNYYLQRGMPVDAEGAYRSALALDSTWLPAYGNLADLLRATGRDGETESVLAAGLAAAPGEPSLLHARGLLRVRQGRLDDALLDLEASARATPETPRYTYVLAVARNSAGDLEGALTEVRGALDRHPYDAELLSLAVSLLLDAGRTDAAEPFERRLRALSGEGR